VSCDRIPVGVVQFVKAAAEPAYARFSSRLALVSVFNQSGNCGIDGRRVGNFAPLVNHDRLYGVALSESRSSWHENQSYSS
jgi:hypothetical protein